MLSRLLGPRLRDVWPRWAERVGGVFHKSGIWGYDAVDLDVGDWPMKLVFTSDVAGPNQGVNCTVLKAPFHNAKGHRFTLADRGIFDRLWHFVRSDVSLGDPVFDKAFRLESGRRADAAELFDREALRRSLPGGTFFMTVLDDEGLTGPRYGEHVDLLYYEEPRAILDPQRLDALLLSFAHLLEKLEDEEGLVNDIETRVAGEPARLVAQAPERTREVLEKVCTFYAGQVERMGQELVARVFLPELGAEHGELRVQVPTLPSESASLTALLPLPVGDEEHDLRPALPTGSLVTWRSQLLDVRSPLTRLHVGDALPEVLSAWHRVARERLGLEPHQQDFTEA